MRKKAGPAFSKGDTAGVFEVLTNGEMVRANYAEYTYFVRCRVCNATLVRTQRALELNSQKNSTNCLRCASKKEFKQKTEAYKSSVLVNTESVETLLAKAELNKSHEELSSFDNDLLTLAMSLPWK